MAAMGVSSASEGSTAQGFSFDPFARRSLRRRSSLWEVPEGTTVLPDGVILRWTSDRASYRFAERPSEGEPFRRRASRRASVRHISRVRQHSGLAFRRSLSLRPHAASGPASRPPVAPSGSKTKFSFRKVLANAIKKPKKALKAFCRRKQGPSSRSSLDD